MLKEGKMKGKFKLVKFISLALSLILVFTTFAEADIYEYFDDLKPQDYINRMFSNERKGELSGNVVNFDDIEDMIHIFNPEVLNNWNSWENNQSAKDVYEEYQDAADILFSSAGDQDSDLQEGMIMAQGRAMQIQADKNASDSYTNFLTDYLIEKQLVLATKILDINYQKSTFELLNAEAAIKEAERLEAKANDALSFGNGTQVELLTAKKAVVDAKSAKIAAESAQRTYKRKLLVNCGKTISDDIYIAPITLTAFNAYSINLDADYQNALAHNIQYEIYRRKIENARTEEVKNEFQILYDAAPQKIYNDLENKYRNILDVMDSISNRELSLKLANENLTKAINEFSSGNISSKDLSTAQHNVTVAQNNLQAAKYDLEAAIVTYQNSVMGYGDC